MPLGLVGVRQECRRRRAAAEGGSRYGQATGADGVGRPAEWLAGVALRGGARRWREARWVAAYFRRGRRCTPVHSQVSQTLPFARHWTNTLHLRLSDSLQSSRFMRSAVCVARAWYWTDNPLNAILRPVSAPSAAKLARSSLHPFFTARRVASLLQTEQSMKARARELAVCVPYVQPSVDSHARSDLCLSPPILSPQSSYQPPQPDAAIRLGPKFQVSTVPAYQGPSCTDACERGDQLLSLAEVELALARTTACRITAAAFHEPGVRLDLVKGEWLAAPRRRRQQPRCSTFGCSLPDLHAGLHQVARATLAPHL